MKNDLIKIFNRYNIFSKANDYLCNNVIEDKSTLEDIFQNEYQNINKENIDKYFKIATFGIDIVVKFDPEMIRYKLSYDVCDEDGDSIKNYYLFFDEHGEYLDDFFD